MHFETKQIAPDTWQINGKGANAYLVCGENEGAMVDSGELNEDLRACAEQLCGKPVKMVLNTHGHFDHTGGNGYFPVAYMGEKAAVIAKTPNGPTDVSDYPLDYEIITVSDGFTVDLGGRVLKAFRMDGHSPDNLAWLDRRERILFTGDNMGPVVPMKYKCKDPQPSMLLYMESVAKILMHREEFDWVCPGHGKSMVDADVVNHTMMAALRALDGETDPEPPHPTPESKAKQGGPGKGPKGPPKNGFAAHDPKDSGCIVYKDARIMFDKRYLKDTTRYDVVEGT